MECLRCGKKFRGKYDVKRHLRSKQLCPPIYLNINENDMLTNYNYYFDIYKKHIYNISMDIEKKNKEKNKKTNTNGVTCEWCGKKFTFKSNCYTHKSKHCRVIKLEQNKKNMIMNELLESKVNLLEINYEDKINEMKEKQEKQDKEKEELINKIKQLEDILSNQLIPTNNTTNNNQMNINNTAGQIAENITNNNHIVINNYGQEDLSSIDRTVFERIAANEYTMIQDMIDYIHIETECNRNVYIPSHKEKYAMILNNHKWDIVDKRELIDNLVYDKRQMLHKLLNIYRDELDTISAKRTQSILEYCESEMGEILKIKSEVLTKLLNNRDNIRYTFEVNNGEKVIYGRNKRIR